VGVGVGVGVAVGVGVGVGVGLASTSGCVVSALPVSRRLSIGVLMRFASRSKWSMIFVFLRFGKFAWTRAAEPATSGAAIDVPLQVPYCPFGTLLRIPSPGAAMPISEPRVEKTAS